MTIRKLHLNKREVRKLDYRASKVEPTPTPEPEQPETRDLAEVAVAEAMGLISPAESRKRAKKLNKKKSKKAKKKK